MPFSCNSFFFLFFKNVGGVPNHYKLLCSPKIMRLCLSVFLCTQLVGVFFLLLVSPWIRRGKNSAFQGVDEEDGSRWMLFSVFVFFFFIFHWSSSLSFPYLMVSFCVSISLQRLVCFWSQQLCKAPLSFMMSIETCKEYWFVVLVKKKKKTPKKKNWYATLSLFI